MTNPPDQWKAVKLDFQSTSEDVLKILNNQPPQVTTAFTQRLVDGLFLFLGFYSKG